MKTTHCWLYVLVVLTITACGGATDVEAPAIFDAIATEYANLGLTEAEIETLMSLEQVDEYPLYKMHYYAPYETVSLDSSVHHANVPAYTATWGCSLFAAFADPESMLYGRNFDWEYSPALLLYTDPADGYASVSMVDIKYLGYESEEQAQGLKDSALPYRTFLLDAPYLPFDGMNEMGLAVGMAAVPPGDMVSDPEKQTIGSLLVIREILDHAGDVDEAVSVLESYNIDYGDAPALHYMIADASGQAALVEFYQSEMHVLYNQNAWHQATNFLRASTGESGEGHCWRYDVISERLVSSTGMLSSQDAVDLLEEISQVETQWSIVYGMSTGDIQVAMGQAYDDVHLLHFRLAEE